MSKIKTMTTKQINEIRRKLRIVRSKMVAAEVLAYSPILRKSFLSLLEKLTNQETELQDELKQSVHEKLTK